MVEIRGSGWLAAETAGTRDRDMARVQSRLVRRGKNLLCFIYVSSFLNSQAAEPPGKVGDRDRPLWVGPVVTVPYPAEKGREKGK